MATLRASFERAGSALGSSYTGFHSIGVLPNPFSVIWGQRRRNRPWHSSGIYSRIFGHIWPYMYRLRVGANTAS